MQRFKNATFQKQDTVRYKNYYFERVVSLQKQCFKNATFQKEKDIIYRYLLATYWANDESESVRKALQIKKVYKTVHFKEFSKEALSSFLRRSIIVVEHREMDTM
ncbi:hypothetical protein YC2023_006133 [Brassica napus]